jgi:NAD(P)-dependent dehydrogenase (short-subunit alcohol dehydrogenase family)
LSREGATVVVADRNATAAEEVARNLPRAAWRTFDQSDRDQCRELVADTVRSNGRVDVLVNCAALMKMSPSAGITEELWQEIFRANLLGPFFVGQLALEEMRRRGRGTVVNVASVAGMRPYAEHVVYGSLKAAMIMMTRIWAVEYGPYGVNVNCISPGLTETPMNEEARRLDPGYEQRFAGSTPARRMGRPAEVAEGIVFLASSGASFMHGANLVVDGGLDLV